MPSSAIRSLARSVAQAVFRAIQLGVCRGCVSVLALGEALTGAKRAGSDALALRYRDVFLRFPNLNMYSIDVDVVERMAGLRATCGLPTPDAIHLASAIAHGARAFLTNDARLKRAEGIEVLLHSDWVTDNEPR